MPAAVVSATDIAKPGFAMSKSTIAILKIFFKAVLFPIIICWKLISMVLKWMWGGIKSMFGVIIKTFSAFPQIIMGAFSILRGIFNFMNSK